MTPKEIGRLAGRIFNAGLPAHWALRNQEDQEDYGIDYEIELITSNDQPTGFIFKVQQKGQLALSTDTAGELISYREISTQKLEYYLRQLKVPVVLVVVGVDAGASYWVTLQGNPHVETAYMAARAKEQKTATVHVPTRNKWPETSDRLLDAVRQAGDWLLVQQLLATSPQRLTSAAAQASDIRQVVEQVRPHFDNLRLEEMEVLIKSRNYQSAFDQAAKILDSASESPHMRVACGVNMVRAATLDAAHAGSMERLREVLPLRADVMQRLLRVVRPRGTEVANRLYVRFQLRSSRVHALATKTMALWMSLKVQEGSGDGLTRYLTAVELQPLVKNLLRELRAAHLQIGRAINRKRYQLVAPMWSGVVHDLMPYLVQLQGGGSTAAALALTEWLGQTGDVAAFTAERIKAWKDVGCCAVAGLLLSNESDPEDLVRRAAHARQMIARIPDDALREEFNAEVAKSVERHEQGPTPMSLHDETSFIRDLAQRMGVDLSDPNDPISQIVNIGLRDRNPERILKRCRFLFVSLGNCGIPGQMLGLPEAGSKQLHCTKHGVSVRGLSLDRLDQVFRWQHCDKCADCYPHPPEWSWSRDWQRQQNEQHQTLLKRVR